MKCLVALNTKQGEAKKYRAMRALATLNNFGHGGEPGVVG
jgi:hypothetical protein